MAEGLYPQCEYPPCDRPVAIGGKRRLVVGPEPVWIRLCAHHAAVIDRKRGDEEHDFWRWADAMLQAPGQG